MANSAKNIVITPNIGSSTADPKIVFSGADASTAAQNITLQIYPTANGTLSFEGSAGQLFSVTNTLTGSIFSVNDVSGIPSIEVIDTGVVKLAQYSGDVLLGSGTDDGVNKLQVNGSVKATTFNATPASDGNPGITLGVAGTVSGIINSPSNMFFNADTGNAQALAGIIGFGFNRIGTAGGTQPLTIVETYGNVGIGTASPGEKLHIYNAAADVALRLQGATNCYIVARSAGATIPNALEILQAGAGPVVILTSNTERMRIDSGGKVGIGTTAPTSLLNIVSGANQASYLTIGQSGQSSWQVGEFQGENSFRISDDGTPFLIEAGAPSNTFYIKGNGNVGIGTATPGYKLEVNGTLSAGATAITGQMAATANVGAGVVTPLVRFHAKGVDADGVQIRLENTTATTGKTWHLVSANDGTARITQTGVADWLTIAPTTGAVTIPGTLGVSGKSTFVGPTNRVRIRTDTQDIGFVNNAESVYTIGSISCDGLEINAKAGVSAISIAATTGAVTIPGNVRIGAAGASNRRLDVSATDNQVGAFRYNTSLTTPTSEIFTMHALTSGIIADGFGGQFTFRTGNTGFDGYLAGRIYTKRNGSDSNHDIYIQPSGSSGLIVKYDGAVTIPGTAAVGTGTGTPTSTFTASRTSLTTPSLTYGADATVTFRGENMELAIGSGSASPYPVWMQARYNANSARALAINPLGGFVSIGGATAGEQLDVIGAIRASQSITIGTGGTYAAGAIYSDSSWGMIFRAKQASPSGAEFRWGTSADVGLMTLYTGGNLTIAGTLTESSSITLKQNVAPITNALDSILKLVGVTYDRKDGSHNNEAGLIAEEVNEVLPNLVSKDEQGNPSGINYTKLTAYLIEAVKTLSAEINILKGK